MRRRPTSRRTESWQTRAVKREAKMSRRREAKTRLSDGRSHQEKCNWKVESGKWAAAYVSGGAEGNSH